jgi:phosphatidylinositol alpha 1,6-mannosyltransferase
MRIALVTESFLPDVNGVANSVVRAAEHLLRRGHEPLVIAPQPPPGTRRAALDLPYPVIRIPSFPMPGYPQIRLGLPTPALTGTMRAYGTEVVHLASPFVLGAWGAAAARTLKLPAVAVYQTDVAAYARAYKVSMTEGAAWKWIKTVHNSAARTLAPSSDSAAALEAHGVQRIHMWRRGVDDDRFHPARRSAGIRRALAPNGELLVGFVGRLAVEKQVELLADGSRLPGVKLIVVGDGPYAPMLHKMLPDATFLGVRHGSQLARIYASLDVFAHTGPYETFGQAVQEAMASGLPVVAPDAGGPRDLVEPDRTGYLVPPFESAGFTEAIATLARDPERRALFGVAGRAAIAGRSWAALGDELIDHYLAAAERAAEHPLGRRDEVGLVGDHDGLDAVAEAEFGQDARDVGLHRRFGQEQAAGDLDVAQSLRDQGQHFAFPGRQRGEIAVQRRRPPRFGCGEAFDQAAGDGRGEQGVAVPDDADRRDQIFGGDVLEQKAAGAQAERRVDVVVQVEGGQHDDPGRIDVGQDASGGLDAVESRHADVHQHHVGPGAPDRLDGLGPVLGLGDHVDAVRREDHPETGAYERLIVGDHDPQRGHGASRGMWAWTR